MTANGTVRGVSNPFQIISKAEDVLLDEDLVVINESSLAGYNSYQFEVHQLLEDNKLLVQVSFDY